MPQRSAARHVENLGPRPPRFLYYSVSEAPALHSKQLFCIRSIKSVSKSFGPYPKCWFRVCNARSVSKTYLPRLTYSDESAHFHFAPGGEALESQLRCPPHPPFRFRPSSVLHSMQRRAFTPTWAHTPLFRFCKFPILASRSCCFHAKHFPLLFPYSPSLISASTILLFLLTVPGILAGKNSAAGSIPTTKATMLLMLPGNSIWLLLRLKA